MTRTSHALTLAAVAACGVLASSPRARGDDAPAAPASRTFSFTYKVTVPAPAAGAKRLDAWVPTPADDQLQKVADLKVTVTSGGKDIPFEQTKDAQYGNTMVHVGVDAPAADVVISWTATITRSVDAGQGTGPLNDRFLQADELVPLEGKATALAKELGADAKDADPLARAKKIYENVLSTMQYSKDDKVAPGWGKGDFDRACEVGKGNCTDFHAKFTGSRARGRTARPLHDGNSHDARGEGHGRRVSLLGALARRQGLEAGRHLRGAEGRRQGRGEGRVVLRPPRRGSHRPLRRARPDPRPEAGRQAPPLLRLPLRRGRRRRDERPQGQGQPVVQLGSQVAGAPRPRRPAASGRAGGWGGPTAFGIRGAGGRCYPGRAPCIGARRPPETFMSATRRLAAALLVGCALALPVAADDAKPAAPAAPAATIPAATTDAKPKKQALPTDPQIEWAIVYKTKVPAPAAGSKRLEAWIPVPFEGELQKVSGLKVTTKAPYEITKDDVTGNRMVHVLVENPPAEDLQIDWSATVLRTQDAGQTTVPLRESDTKGDKLAPIDGVAKKLAKDLGVDDASTPVAVRARRINDHVLQSMAYDKETPGWGNGDLERAVKLGKGNCSDFAAKFIAIARAAGIPARWTSSIALSTDHANCSACGYHCYPRFFDGVHWIPVDPSDARRAVADDPRKADWLFGHQPATSIVLSVGRDLTLVPKQQAGPVNFFGGPYVEVDGKPVKIPSENRTYDFEAK